MWIPDVILLGPAGAKAYMYLSCLKRLFEEKMEKIEKIEKIEKMEKMEKMEKIEKTEEHFLSNVKNWIGVSAGAALSLLIVSGYSIDEITNICMEINLTDDIMSINIDEARQKLGLIKNKTIEDKLKYYISLKFGFIPNLKQLYSLSGIGLSMATFNLDKMRPEFLDKDSEPELCCVEAAMMSMAVPILMQPRKYKGYSYIDGALGSPYPISVFDHDDKKILGLYISSEEDCIRSDNNPASFLYRLIHSSMKVLRDNEIKYASKNVKHIVLKSAVKDTTGLTINTEMKQNMLNQGYSAADNFLKIVTNPEKYDISLKENEEIPFSN